MPTQTTIVDVLSTSQDKFTGMLKSISGDHGYIHLGGAFTIIGNTGSLSAAGGAYSISLTTPVAGSEKYVHFRPLNFTATANTMTMVLNEGSTVTGGSAYVPLNRNRISPKKSSVAVSVGVTESVAGTTIQQFAVGGGANPASRTGGSSGADNELVLMPNTTYCITITNVGSTTASTGYFEIYWYEEPHG